MSLIDADRTGCISRAICAAIPKDIAFGRSILLYDGTIELRREAIGRDEMSALSKTLAAIFLAGLILLTLASANAAPPPSCAGKFVGVWRHQAIGTSNIATLTANGTAACSGNPYCVQGTWTCSGNVLTYNNGISNTQYTLQPNGTMTAGGGIVVTRLGRAPPAAKSEDNEQASIQKEQTRSKAEKPNRDAAQTKQNTPVAVAPTAAKSPAATQRATADASRKAPISVTIGDKPPAPPSTAEPTTPTEKAKVAAVTRMDTTSNGNEPTPTMPSSNAPTTVSIGKKPIAPSTPSAAGGNNSGGEKNVPTPCQDLNGPHGCQMSGVVPDQPKSKTANNVEPPSIKEGQPPSDQDVQQTLNYILNGMQSPAAPADNSTGRQVTELARPEKFVPPVDPCAHPPTLYWRQSETAAKAAPYLKELAGNLERTRTCIDRRQAAEAYRELAAANGCLASTAADAAQKQAYDGAQEAAQKRSEYIDDDVDKDDAAGKCNSTFGEIGPQGPPSAGGEGKGSGGSCSFTDEQLQRGLAIMTDYANKTRKFAKEIADALKAKGGDGCKIPDEDTCRHEQVYNHRHPLGCRNNYASGESP
jgi:hypothetical protein